MAREHSTIALLVTTDGTICDIPREAYEEAEIRAVNELRASGKPFAIILNSARPETDAAHLLATELEEKYEAPVALLNCTKLDESDVEAVLSLIIGEFPVRMLTFKLPGWISVLPEEHRIREEVSRQIREYASEIRRISDIERVIGKSGGTSYTVNAADGTAQIDMALGKDEYFAALGELTGVNISGERELLLEMISLSKAAAEYEKVKDALADVKEKGYGIVMPGAEDLTISEPTLQKQSDGYGIKLSAVAESIHMIRTDLKAEICPVVGGEEQASEVVRSLTSDYEEDPKRILETKMFGRSLYDMVSDGMQAKLLHLPDVSRERIGQTLEKIVNEGANGLICILL